MGTIRTGRARIREITESEADYVEWIALGMTNDEIAEAMEVSPRTVKYYVDQLRVKLDVELKREIPMAWWRRTGINPYPKKP